MFLFTSRLLLEWLRSNFEVAIVGRQIGRVVTRTSRLGLRRTGSFGPNDDVSLTTALVGAPIMRKEARHGKSRRTTRPEVADGAGWMVTGACAVALLHFAQPVLEPLAAAGILTLTLAPLVRRVRAFGLGHAAATFVSVGFVAACVVALGAVLASQLAEVVRELPQYRAAIGSKLEQMSASVLRPLDRWEAEIARTWPDRDDSATGPAATPDVPAPSGPVPVEIRNQRPGSGATLRGSSPRWGGRSKRWRSRWCCCSSCCWAVTRSASA